MQILVEQLVQIVILRRCRAAVNCYKPAGFPRDITGSLVVRRLLHLVICRLLAHGRWPPQRLIDLSNSGALIALGFGKVLGIVTRALPQEMNDFRSVLELATQGYHAIASGCPPTLCESDPT